MNAFPINSTVTITVPIVDLNDNPVTPTGLTFVVLDGNYEALAPETNLFGAYTTGDTSIDAVISHTLNASAGPRVLEFTITDAAGNEYTTQTVYAINLTNRLVFLQNTFQSHAEALYLAQDIPNLDGWDTADAKTQQTAMIEAFSRLIRMNFVIPYPEMVDTQALLDPNYYAEITPRMWPHMTEALFDRYPEAFYLALCKAQIAEANYIVAGDPIGDKVRSGLFSEKIGESSMMFRSGIAPLKLPLARQSFDYLTGYINNRLTISRI